MNKSECIVVCQKPEAAPESQRYDVYVAPSGARFEYGPRRMRVVGEHTDEDKVEFVRHIRSRQQARAVKESSQVRVLGIRMG